MAKKKQPPTASKDEEVPFEEAMARVEAIVDAMESDGLGLEQMLSQYEEGSKLLSYCQMRLESAQKRIEIIASERQNGTVSLKSFEEGAQTAETDAPSPATTTEKAEPDPEIRLF